MQECWILTTQKYANDLAINGSYGFILVLVPGNDADASFELKWANET